MHSIQSHAFMSIIYMKAIKVSCSIKVSCDHNINARIPGRPQSLLERITNQTASWQRWRSYQNKPGIKFWKNICQGFFKKNIPNAVALNPSRRPSTSSHWLGQRNNQEAKANSRKILTLDGRTITAWTIHKELWKISETKVNIKSH